MISSYSLNINPNFYQRFDTHNQLDNFPQESQIFPNQTTPVIMRENVNFAWPMKWGLIPFWAKNRGVGDRLTGVSYDSLITKPAFKNSFLHHRCLIPANNFSFLVSQNGQKTKYDFTLDNHPTFSFAGIYDIWEEPVSGLEVYSFAIITVPSNPLISNFSQQTPVILSPSSESDWLSPSTPITQIKSLLKFTREPFSFQKISLDK